MLNVIGIHTWYFIGVPSEHVHVVYEEVCEFRSVDRLSSRPILKYFSGSEEKVIVSDSSQGEYVSVQVSLAFSDCYKPLEHCAAIFPFFLDSGGFCLTAAMMHCLEATWSPLISIIPKSVGKRSF